MDPSSDRLKRRAAIAAVASLAVFILSLGGIELHRRLRIAALNPRVDVRQLAERLGGAESSSQRQKILNDLMPNRTDLLAAVVAGPDADSSRGEADSRVLALWRVHPAEQEVLVQSTDGVVLATIGGLNARIVATYPRRESLIHQSLLGPSPLGMGSDGPPGGPPGLTPGGPPMSRVPLAPAPGSGPDNTPMPGAPMTDLSVPKEGLLETPAPPAPPAEVGPEALPPSASAPMVPFPSRFRWCSQPGVSCQSCHAGAVMSKEDILGLYLARAYGRDDRLAADRLRIIHPHLQRALTASLRERDWPSLQTEWISVSLQDKEERPTGHLLVLPRPRVGTYTFATYYLRNAAYLGAAVSLLLYLFMLPWWVYLDARPRTERALPLAIFVGITNFLGWLTYLVIRPEEQRQCPGCATLLEPGFRLCPFCGWGAASRCRQCGRPARAEWHFCPYCETPRQIAPEVSGH